MTREGMIIKPALFKYRTVRYFPFDVEPSDQLVLTADPWSFLYAFLDKRAEESRGKNRVCYKNARYYAQLAEGFYNSADNSRLPVKGTLIYYGMLNLVKALLSIHGVSLGTTREHHGLTLPEKSKFKVQIHGRFKHATGIFQELCKVLGKPPVGTSEITLKEIFSHIPEIHEIATSLGILSWSKPKFLPIQIQFNVNATNDQLFTNIKYRKHWESRVNIGNFVIGKRKKYFRKIGESDGWVSFQSRRKKKLTRTDSNWSRVYKNICDEYSTLDIVSLLTREGYQFYCDLRPGSFNHLCYSLMAMFYVGSVARYRPSETEELMGGEWRPLVTEAVATLPTQFLYHVVSYCTKKTMCNSSF